MTRAHGRGNARAVRAATVPWVVLAVASCASTSDDRPLVLADVPETVAIGGFPPPLSDAEPPPTPATFVPPRSTTTTTDPGPRPIDGPIGEAVVGNRLLLVGDTVFATMAPRNDGLACEVLNDFGWDVEVAAEPGRFVGFGRDVLDERLRPATGDDWDVVALMLGNHFDGDPVAFEETMATIVDRISPRPVVLFTLTEVEEGQRALNDIVRELARAHPNVVLVDWAALSAAEPEILLDDGGPQVTPDGSGRIVLFIAAALGAAPGDQETGECLPEVYVDDSAIVL